MDTTGTQGTATLVDADMGLVRYDPNGQFESLAEGATATDTFSYTVSGEIPGTRSTVTGRFIKIQNNGFVNRELHIGEIEVFAPGVPPAADFDSANDLALSTKGATVESTVGGGGHGNPLATIDGAEQTGGDTWTRVAVGAEIVIDLGASFDIERVRVHQRNDGCCQERLRNFTVSVLEDNAGNPGAVVHSSNYPAQPPTNGFAEITFPERITEQATVTVTVTGQNDAPVAVDDGGYLTNEDAPFQLPADVYANTVLADAPAVYYRLNEVGGTDVTNAGTAGSAMDATANGGVDLGAGGALPGHPGNSGADLDGSNDYILSDGNLTSAQFGGTQYTV
jgi:hypothetical protein